MNFLMIGLYVTGFVCSNEYNMQEGDEVSLSVSFNGIRSDPSRHPHQTLEHNAQRVS